MIKNEEVQKIANLAKFNLSDSEISHFASQLNEIMNMIDILNEVDCTNVEPLSSVCDMNQRMRNDAVLYNDLSDQLFTNIASDKAQLAKEVKCFVVPKIVE